MPAPALPLARVPWRIQDAPSGRRTHTCAEKGPVSTGKGED
jgi:hypothetical protein